MKRFQSNKTSWRGGLFMLGSVQISRDIILASPNIWASTLVIKSDKLADSPSSYHEINKRALIDGPYIPLHWFIQLWHYDFAMIYPDILWHYCVTIYSFSRTHKFYQLMLTVSPANTKTDDGDDFLRFRDNNFKGWPRINYVESDLESGVDSESTSDSTQFS